MMTRRKKQEGMGKVEKKNGSWTCFAFKKQKWRGFMRKISGVYGEGGILNDIVYLLKVRLGGY